MSDELRQVYESALELTHQQAQAIDSDDWDLLVALLAKRERCFDRAEALLHDTPHPANRPELVDLLKRIHSQDQANHRRFEQKRAELQQELGEVRQAESALSGYMNALRSWSTDAQFIDRES